VLAIDDRWREPVFRAVGRGALPVCPAKL